MAPPGQSLGHGRVVLVAITGWPDTPPDLEATLRADVGVTAIVAVAKGSHVCVRLPKLNLAKGALGLNGPVHDLEGDACPGKPLEIWV
jgi:hypothetical protein